MPLAALILGGGITRTRPYPSVEPFTLGSVSPVSVEPFDIIGPLAFGTSVEEFWMLGTAARISVEPFDLGSLVFARSVEPFDIIDGGTPLLDSTDLGDGLPEAATAQPIYGWWETADDVPEDLGPMETD